MSDILTVPRDQLPPASSESLMEWLRPVQDPELFMSLVDLGLIYKINLDGSNVSVEMTLTSPGCPAVDQLVSSVKYRIQDYPGVSAAEVKIVFDPKWDPATMASDEVKDKMGIW